MCSAEEEGSEQCTVQPVPREEHQGGGGVYQEGAKQRSPSAQESLLPGCAAGQGLT